MQCVNGAHGCKQAAGGGRGGESHFIGEVARRAVAALRERLRIRALFGSVLALAWHVAPWCGLRILPIRYRNPHSRTF